MHLYQKALQNIQLSKERKDSGLLNCIPSPFPRFAEYWPGTEKGKYSLVTANAKVGKSQITDFMFLYHPVDFILNNETNFDIKILYYSLEMSSQQKTLQAISYFLKKFYGIYVSPLDLRSLKRSLDSDIIDKIKKLEPFFEKYFEKVEYIDNIRNRYGIWLDIFDYAKNSGTIEYEDRIIDGAKTRVIKSYTPNNPDLITEIIVDHASLLTPENGDTLHQAIGKLSSQDFVKARNLFGFNPVLIQQQASDQESLEHKKADALMPTLAGLADNKTTQRDVDFAIGLFNPARHGFTSFKGYDINKFGDRFRSVEILANREGSGTTITPLYFRGECSYFEELPLPGTEEIRKFNP